MASDKDKDPEKNGGPTRGHGEFPEPPDPAKVRELRDQMNQERRAYWISGSCMARQQNG